MSYDGIRAGWQAIMFLAGVMVFLLCQAGSGEDEKGANGVEVEWGQGHRSLTFRFKGRERSYPRDVVEGEFPPPGAKPEYVTTEEWPIVMFRARWSSTLKNWAEAYRPGALDLILMYSCDAELYEYIYPGIVLKSHCAFPPEYLEKARDPLNYRLAESLCGKHVAYEMTAMAGFAASDYKIKTEITIGLSEDSKTVFFYDHPHFISEHLKERHFSFAAHDAGDRLQFEGIMLCVCAPRVLFKGETLRRISKSGRYFVDRIYEDVNEPLTAKDVETYMKIVRSKYKSIDAILKREGYDVEELRKTEKVLP